MRQPVRSWYSRRAGITGLVLAAWSWSACTRALGALAVAAFAAFSYAGSMRAD